MQAHSILATKEQYKDAIYTGPTIRFINISDSQLENLKKELDIFVSDSGYRNHLRGSYHTENYGDFEDRSGGGLFYGTGGCATVKDIQDYGNNFIGGAYIGINTVDKNDKERVKLNFNKLYFDLVKDVNPFVNENEVLHVFLDEDGSILKEPAKEKSSFSRYVAWVVLAEDFSENPDAMVNILNPDEVISFSAWYAREKRKAEDIVKNPLSQSKDSLFSSVIKPVSVKSNPVPDVVVKQVKAG